MTTQTFTLECIGGTVTIDRSLFPVIGGVFVDIPESESKLVVPFSAIEVSVCVFFVTNLDAISNHVFPLACYPIFEHLKSEKYSSPSYYRSEIKFPRSDNVSVEDAGRDIMKWVFARDAHFDCKNFPQSLVDKITQNEIEIFRNHIAEITCYFDDRELGILFSSNIIVNTPYLKAKVILFNAQYRDTREAGTLLRRYDILEHIFASVDDPEFRSLTFDFEELIEYHALLAIAISGKCKYLKGFVKIRTISNANNCNSVTFAVTIGNNTFDIIERFIDEIWPDTKEFIDFLGNV